MSGLQSAALRSDLARDTDQREEIIRYPSYPDDVQ